MNDLTQIEPYSCLFEILKLPYSVCDEKIDQKALEAANNAFESITGFNYDGLLETITRTNKEFYQYQISNLFLFVPMFLIVVLVALIFVLLGHINWIAGAFMIVIGFLVIYYLSYSYRTIIVDLNDKENKRIKESLEAWKMQYQNSLAYLPQAIAAIACAVVKNGSEDAWKCNPKPCKVLNEKKSKKKSSKKENES
jgi:hypothetical protein